LNSKASSTDFTIWWEGEGEWSQSFPGPGNRRELSAAVWKKKESLGGGRAVHEEGVAESAQREMQI